MDLPPGNSGFYIGVLLYSCLPLLQGGGPPNLKRGLESAAVLPYYQFTFRVLSSTQYKVLLALGFRVYRVR